MELTSCANTCLTAWKPRPASLPDMSRAHWLTIAPGVLKYARQWRSIAEREVAVTQSDPALGTVRMTGLYAKALDADTLVAIVHGHGGNADKPYCHSAAVAARRWGFSSLRISLRGADLTGEDIYHGGLTTDLAAFTSRPEFAHYRKLILFGYSMGGHLALRAALDGVDRRLSAVIAISPPLDIPGAVAALDQPRRFLYRSYILGGLRKIYAAAAARQRATTPLQTANRANTFREWDDLTVVPRFGFRGVDDYYERITLANRLHNLRVPALVVGSNHDPVIPAAVMRNALRGASNSLTSRWIDGGGHLYFPKDTDLQIGPAPLGLLPQCMHWARRNAA